VNTATLCRLSVVIGATLVAACSDKTPFAPSRPSAIATGANRQRDETLNPDLEQALATIRAATAQYHDIQNALNDGFVLRHACQTPGDDGPTGDIYANRTRVRDGVIDPALPDALIYEPTPDGPRLVGVELAIPYTLWTNPDPPMFFGTPFQREDGFGVYGLHVWIWLHNPNGMFEETNPNVQC
jgi:hypothetical protein